MWCLAATGMHFAPLTIYFKGRIRDVYEFLGVYSLRAAQLRIILDLPTLDHTVESPMKEIDFNFIVTTQYQHSGLDHAND